MAIVPGTTRREFLQQGIAAAGAAALGVEGHMAVAEATQHSGKRPNLVFFLGEGQRADALSLHGHPLARTPHHDRLAREGVHFRNAFVTNALCAPARAVLLSGMYSASTGALANNEEAPMPKDIPLFTELLHDAGYDVAVVGKTHMRNGAEDRYWDYYFGHNAAANNYYNPMYKEGRKGKIGPQKQYKNVWADDLAVDKALAWLEEDRGERPFCLLVWFMAPHSPFYRPRRFLDNYNGTPVSKPATFDDDLKGYPGKPRAFAEANNKIGTTVLGDTVRSLEELAKDYYACLQGVDDNIGRVLGYLEKRKLLDDTAIVHTSDHGYFMGEWRCFDKRQMHEPSIRVPLMIRYPKLIKAGSTRDEMTLDIDIAPTLLELAGVKPASRMQGKSLLPVSRVADPEFRKEWCYEYFEFPNPEMVRPHRGIRTERYKLMHYTMDPQEFEMYDLQIDPGELNNLYGRPEHAALQHDLMARMAALRAAIPVYQPAAA